MSEKNRYRFELSDCDPMDITVAVLLCIFGLKMCVGGVNDLRKIFKARSEQVIAWATPETDEDIVICLEFKSRIDELKLPLEEAVSGLCDDKASRPLIDKCLTGKDICNDKSD